MDCARLGKGGYSVPSIVEPEYIEIRRCTADFVLLVEKGTQWNRLSEDKFWRRYNCVLLTGNGQPPRGVRRLARRLHEEYKLPVYVLVDNDPWGYYIYSVVKQGSINLAFESERMAIPKAKFIGLSSADPDAYGLPRTVGIKLNDKDMGRAKELLKYRWFQKKPWQDEIKRMLGERPQVRAGRPRQQGLPLPDEDVPAPEAQGRGLAGLRPAPRPLVPYSPLGGAAMSDKRFSVYFSHSWRPADVDCNQVVWKEISPRCNLLVEEDLVEQPPDHVTRLEEYIRRSDLFLAVLPYRADAKIAAGAVGDGAARCSHPALFEIRLAERARKPRFVLYDTRVRFQRGSETGAHVVYQPFEPPHLLQQSGTYVHAAIRTVARMPSPPTWSRASSPPTRTRWCSCRRPTTAPPWSSASASPSRTPATSGSRSSRNPPPTSRCWPSSSPAASWWPTLGPTRRATCTRWPIPSSCRRSG